MERKGRNGESGDGVKRTGTGGETMTAGAEGRDMTVENKREGSSGSALEKESETWQAAWITRQVPDHREWDVQTLEVRVSLKIGGTAEIWFAVRDDANRRICRLDLAQGRVELERETNGRRQIWASADAPELGGLVASRGAQDTDPSREIRQAGPHEDQAAMESQRQIAVRIVQEKEGVRVWLNEREALEAVLSPSDPEAERGQGETIGTIGFRAGQEAAVVYRELRVFGAEGRALYVNRFYDPAALHFSSGGLDPSGNGLRLEPGMSSLCEEPVPVDAPLFRRTFKLTSPPVQARLRVYSLGWYELTLNGRKIGDRVLTPANTPYEQRMLFDTYEGAELLELLHGGENGIGAMLGGGYNFNYSRWGWKWKRDKALIAQLDLTLEDGSVLCMGTDETWSTAPGPLLMQDIYDGETYDARRLPEGWDCPEGVRLEGEQSGQQIQWEPAVLARSPEAYEGLMQPNSQPPIRTHQPIQPICAYQPEPGVTVYDFGQNLAGWVRIRIRGQAGDEVELRYSELIDTESADEASTGRYGRIDPWTNRNARACDVYLLKGGHEEQYEPRFTYHGFRYAQVRLPASTHLLSIEAVPVHADVRESGTFRSSDPLLEQLQANLRRSILNNLVSIPTDCCQRDERTPCLMDSAVVEEAAIHNFDMKAYYRKWMGDISGSDSNPDWSGDRVTLPWYLYQYYGDLELLREGYPSMSAYLDYLAGRWPEHVVTEGFGDWCPPNDDGWENYFGEPELVNTALYAMQAGTAAQAAAALGLETEAARFQALAGAVRQAFERRFAQGEGVYGSGSQTAQLLPLAFGLVPAEQIDAATNRLVAAIEEKGRHLDTGIYGTRYLLDVLADHGQVDLAYELLTTKSYPGFGWQIEQGATTLWEQWSFKGGMHSHDHAMFGGIGASFYTRLAGITPLEPGYARIGIRPHMPAGLDWAEGELHTPVGRIFSGWRREQEQLLFTIEIPDGAAAEAALPAGAAYIGGEAAELLLSSSHSEPDPRGAAVEAARQTFVLNAGRHEFALPLRLLSRRS
ncbi:hypothetical protein B9G55_17595 [Saccharibacillus sp. O16]|nr:hypothetical protein B9G55_17595 [Saccharibacillus sp. O16]